MFALLELFNHSAEACPAIDRLKELEKMIPEKDFTITEKDIKKVLEGEPPIEELFKHALNYLGLNPSNVREWRKGVKKAALLPKLQIGFKKGLNDRITVSVDDHVSVSSSGVVVGPQTSSFDKYANNETSFDVMASWNLDHLVFRKEMLNISSEARYLSQDRQEVLDRINFAYHERVRWLAYLLGAGRRSEMRALIELYLLELKAVLDGLTGGWYSRWKESG